MTNKLTEAVARAIADLYGMGHSWPRYIPEATVAIAAYRKEVASEAVGHVAERTIDKAKSDGKLYEHVMMFFGPYAGSFGNEPYLTLFAAPPAPEDQP